MTDTIQSLRNYTYIAGAGTGVAAIFSGVAYWQRRLAIADVTLSTPSRTTFKEALLFAKEHVGEITGMKGTYADLKRWHGLLKLGVVLMLFSGVLAATIYQKTKALEAQLKPPQ